MNEKPKILVILGSIRQGRHGEKITQWFLEKVRGFEGAQIELADLREFPLPFFEDEVLPGMREGGHANPAVQRWLDRVAWADAYVIVTPEYNFSISSALKNALDFPYKEWNNKPVAFVSYGSAAGGTRAAEHLRQIVAQLQMFDIREQIIIPWVKTAFDAEGHLVNEEAHTKNALAIVQKLAQLAELLKPMRSA